MTLHFTAGDNWAEHPMTMNGYDYYDQYYMTVVGTVVYSESVSMQVSSLSSMA